MENKKLGMLIITDKEFGQEIKKEFSEIGGKFNGGIGRSLYGSIDIENLDKLAKKDWCTKIIAPLGPSLD